MAQTVLLGEITCPSGELVLVDGGYLGLWSGTRSPDDVAGHDRFPAVDFEVVGPDAEAAARSFDRQSGRTLHDIPRHATDEFTGMFADHCREHGLDATLRRFPRRVAHRDRIRRAVAEGRCDFLMSGVPGVVVGGLPVDRPLPVTATPGEWGWRRLRIEVGTARAVRTRMLGPIGVDCARFAFADADALNAWMHDDPIDGRADIVFWGRDEAALAAELGAPATGTPGDDVYGWLDLPVAEAHARAVALDELRNRPDGHRFAYDFRPHSHHWQVMAGVRASEHEAGTIDVGAARIMFAMTSVGDGFFPVHAELDAAGGVVAVEVTVSGEPPP
ncbi:hypothetical protein [Polymorphospora rubra]|uniref:Uncharacterized protein n=1 Tax=Polymorphospora rubra TaxID=338584 RepID=A0A810N661_9ACTN|nr:hypothetical protein [Polymorphospora rubra]BCJ68896.1 hypothetical protein Prubr_59170 [Polymorphospora rubra]